MTQHRDPDGSLLLTYDSTRLSSAAAAATLALLVTAAYDHFLGPRGDDRLIGLLGAAATTGIMAMVLLERARFRIDSTRRAIDWDQRFLLRHRAGTLAFDEVRFVSVDVPIGDSGVPNRRIVLHLANGTLLPMTMGYQPDSDGAIAGAAAALRQELGHSAPTVAESVRALLEEGRTIDAVKVVVARERLSLTDARRRVEEIAREPGRR